MLQNMAKIAGLYAISAHSYAEIIFKPYGTLDYGYFYSYSDAGENHDFKSGMASTSQLGMNFKYKLNEDISIIGKLESGVNLKEAEFIRDTLFNRQENIGIESERFGKLLYGRQHIALAGLADDPFLGVTAFSPLVMVAASSSGLGTGSTSLDYRASKSWSYRTPRLNNFKTKIIYTSNMGVGKKGPNVKNFGVLSTYDNKIHKVGFSYNELINNKTSILNKEVYHDVKTKLYNTVYGYKPNDNLRFSFNYYYLKPDSPDAVSAKIYGFGVFYNKPKYILRTSIFHRDVKEHQLSATAFAIGAEYHLTPNLDTYIRAGYVRNNENSKFTVNGTPVLGYGDDPYSIGYGFRFRF
ncbi:porin [Acinetobacter oleivorans]|uniref:porin n=1 Tax=Acinetobacter oleivorans TaxID=1148157 RepID=UPI00125F2EB2|nr:porin [Acinetobacter oleivorans]